MSFLSQRNPFSLGDPSLRSIASGVVAEPNVNVDKASEVGESILKLLKGEDVLEYSFKKTNQAVTLASKINLKINKSESIQVDPGLLFQRLSIVATSGNFPDPLPFLNMKCVAFLQLSLTRHYVHAKLINQS